MSFELLVENFPLGDDCTDLFPEDSVEWDAFHKYLQEEVLPEFESIKARIERLKKRNSTDSRNHFIDVCTLLAWDRSLPFREWIGEEKTSAMKARARAKALQEKLDGWKPKANTVPHQTDARILALVAAGKQPHIIARTLELENLTGAHGKFLKSTSVERRIRKLKGRL